MKMAHMSVFLGFILVVTVIGIWLASGSRFRDSKMESELAKLDQYDFRWYEPGGENLFNKKVLDVRSLTWTMCAVTGDSAVAQRFNELRSSDGKHLLDKHMENPVTYECALVYPYSGEAPSGPVFKAGSMEEKWDIYVYDSIFYFARSWTGYPVFKAYADISDTAISIRRIDLNAPVAEAPALERAVQDVHFLMLSHVFNRVCPHHIPPDVPDDPRLIAIYSFKIFGNKACYATRDGMLDLEVSDVGQDHLPMPEGLHEQSERPVRCIAVR
jgi:hypothetical protein